MRVHNVCAYVCGVRCAVCGVHHHVLQHVFAQYVCSICAVLYMCCVICDSGDVGVGRCVLCAVRRVPWAVGCGLWAVGCAACYLMLLQAKAAETRSLEAHSNAMRVSKDAEEERVQLQGSIIRIDTSLRDQQRHHQANLSPVLPAPDCRGRWGCRSPRASSLHRSCHGPVSIRDWLLYRLRV